MTSDAGQFWAILLIVAAAVSLAFAVRRIMRGDLHGLRAAGAVVFRLGLMLVGAVYATGLVYRSRAAVLTGFGVAAVGILLNLLGGVAARRRHRQDADATIQGNTDDA
jgi:protein-S-isoprenylcysteine O-methyltransferase Ste14